MRMLLAGNWKMNGLKASIAEIRSIKRGLSEQAPRSDILICPPATLIAEAAKAAEGGPIAIGGQDCHPLPHGAFTGDVSAEMLRDAGATAVILGHSERRQNHGETDSVVAAKIKAAQRAGLTAILCVGESEGQRDKGLAVVTVTEQLLASMPVGTAASDLVVAYEPIWAIGTGKTPRAYDVAQMHEALRSTLIGHFGKEGGEVRILYGGSVKPDNAAELLAIRNVDGALIGGASLKAGDFLAIIRATPRY